MKRINEFGKILFFAPKSISNSVTNFQVDFNYPTSAWTFKLQRNFRRNFPTSLGFRPILIEIFQLHTFQLKTYQLHDLSNLIFQQHLSYRNPHSDPDRDPNPICNPNPKIWNFCEGKKNDCNLGKTWNSTEYGTRSICDEGMNIMDDDDVLGELEIFNFKC